MPSLDALMCDIEGLGSRASELATDARALGRPDLWGWLEDLALEVKTRVGRYDAAKRQVQAEADRAEELEREQEQGVTDARIP